MKKTIGIMMCIGCMCFCACAGNVNNGNAVETMVSTEAESNQNTETMTGSKEETDKDTNTETNVEPDEDFQGLETENGMESLEELDASEIYGTTIDEKYLTNESFRFYLSANEPDKFGTISCTFFVEDNVIKHYENIDLSNSKGVCFAFDRELLGGADDFEVLITYQNAELLRLYGTEPYCYCDVFGVDLFIEEDGSLESALAGAVLEHIGPYFDKQGTSDVYSVLVITQNIPESCQLSEVTYDVSIELYRLADLEGRGEFEGDILHFIPDENSLQVYGDITFGEFDECAIFTVTQSGTDLIKVGDSFEFND